MSSLEAGEQAIITVLCMVYTGDKILLQDRVKQDWRGLTFPGGHVEPAESFVAAVIRELKEETGLTIYNPRLCGIKQFQTENDTRYIVLLFKTNQFSGNLCSSSEGEMMWLNRADLVKFPLVKDFFKLLEVFDNDDLNEFIYKKDCSSGQVVVNLY